MVGLCRFMMRDLLCKFSGFQPWVVAFGLSLCCHHVVISGYIQIHKMQSYVNTIHAQSLLACLHEFCKCGYFTHTCILSPCLSLSLNPSSCMYAHMNICMKQPSCFIVPSYVRAASISLHGKRFTHVPVWNKDLLPRQT